MSNTSSKVRETALTAVLAAIVLLMAFTPLGYLRIGPVSITFLVIPVVIGGMTLGPVRGGFLGAVFGATSLAQCFMGDPFGAALVALSPMATAVACFVPRILIGVVAGLLFPALHKLTKINAVSFIATSIAGTLTNTVLFVGMVVGFFQGSYFGGSPFWTIFVSFFTFNVALELVVGVAVSAALSAVLDRFVLNAPRYQVVDQIAE
ncbi:MAG: ECF transporter S component [Oscillospiraceae bacterium]|nr:ECF transporter S component [Oscillospiraceae bacterium]